jgi:hypothetical protein
MVSLSVALAIWAIAWSRKGIDNGRVELDLGVFVITGIIDAIIALLIFG